MTAPTYVGAAAADGGATPGNTYTNTFTSISPADGDYLVWAIMIESTSITLSTPPSGWTLRYNSASVGSRTVLIYDKIWHTGDATSLSYVKSGGFADGNTVAAYRGVNSGSIIYGTGQRRADQSPTNSFTNTAPSITTTIADTRAIFISVEATSSAETGGFVTGPTMPSGWTQDYYKAQGTTIETLAFAHKDMPSTGATSDAIATYQNTQASNGYAVQIGLAPTAIPITGSFAGSGSFTATVIQGFAATAPLAGSGTFVGNTGSGISADANFAGSGALTSTSVQKYSITPGFSGSGSLTALNQLPVDLWILNTPMFVAHRGGSVSWQQHTMNAYDNAVGWNSKLALEASVWQSSDGIWVCNHDQNTGTTGTWNASYDIPTTTWATLSTVRSTVGNYPMIRLTDLLTKYGSSRIFFIDDKPNLNQSAFLDLLDAYVGPGRAVVKAYYNNHSMSVAAHARGYKTWGYYYNPDVVSSASTYTDWDILGLETSATTPNWTTMKGYGRPVLAHIIQNTTQYATAQTQTPAGYMVADVNEVVPQSGQYADLNGTGALTAAISQGLSSTAGLVGSGSLTAAIGQGYLAAQNGVGFGSLSAIVKQGYSITQGISGSGSFTAPIVQGLMAVATMAGSGGLVITVEVGSNFAVYVWDGTDLIPASIGVWDGVSVVPAIISEIV